MEVSLEENTVAVNQGDSFAYLERNSFSSEKFKIQIRGLPKYCGINELRKLLNSKLKLKCSKIKPPKAQATWVYVCFRSEEDREVALEKISGYVWKNKTLQAQPASAVPDPLIQKRNELKKSKESNEITNKIIADPKELLKANTVPLWNVPYTEQLQMKMDRIKLTLQKLGNELLFFYKSSTSIRKFLEDKTTDNDRLPCKLEQIRHASEESIMNGYRNKCEFTIGLNEQTGKKTVGFRFGSYAEGTINVGPVDDMPHVTVTMKKIVTKLESFIQESNLDVYNPENHTGFWKQLTVRHGMRTNEIMVIVGVNMYGIPNEIFELTKASITNLFSDNEPPLTSLYLQVADFTQHQKSTANSLHLLYGSATITEIICGLKFFISPSSFFQPHTNTAEILYSTVNELTSLSAHVTVLDICCGTGTIGLCVSKNGCQVLGIESEEAAIQNAKINCQRNGVENCSFFHGRAEDILPSVISKAVNKNIVAIVDPPRAGLHQKTIIQLRRTTNIDKLIYLSCNPDAAFKNFVTLGKPPSKTLLGSPFFPVKAIPVDNFPFTNHCELIIYFERYNNEFQIISNES